MSESTSNIRGFSAGVPRRIKKVLTSIDPLPIRRTIRHYNAGAFKSDLGAGFSVALLAFPQGMAFSMIAGLPISYGLFATVVACLVGPLFAGSRFVVLGPTNGTAALLLSAFLATGFDQPAMMVVLPLLLVMTGLLQIAAAYLNIGSFVAYISRSVIIGYISAAAVIIATRELPNVTGIALEETRNPIGAIGLILVQARTIDWPTVLTAAATAAVYLVLKRFLPRLPTVGLTLVAGAGIGFGTQLAGYPIDMLPEVAVTAWRPTIPDFDFGAVHQLASAALALAFLSVLEGASIGKTLATRAGQRLPDNQVAFATGMANVACGFFGGMPASGSLTRSVLNATSGAVTSISSIFCGLITLGLILGLGGFIGHVPRASLAVVVIFVALSLINLRQIRFVIRSTRTDALVFAVTAGSAFIVPLDAAIFLGTATSIALFLRKAGEPELVEYAFNPEGELTEVKPGERPLPEISIVHVEGSLFFGAAELLHEQIRRVWDEPNLKIIILRLKHAHHLDASAVLAIEELVQAMRENNRALIVSGARKEVVRICRRTGLIDLIGRGNFFPEWPQNPTLATRNALLRAQQLLGQKEAEVRVFSEMKTRRPEPDKEAEDE